MRKVSYKRASASGAVALMLALAGSAAPAVAAPFSFELDPGQGCAFGLGVSGTGGDHRGGHTFVDANGNPVRIIDAGRGSRLTFTNLSTGATLTLRANGAVTNTVINPDGSSTVTTTGHNVLILFPTDVPAGPSTTLFTGRVVFTVSPTGVFTLLSTAGTSTDICAALA
jgi:hypothetical protein